MSATMSAPPVLTAARRAYAAGLCPVPPRQDGSKAPIEAWKDYQEARPSPEQLRAWFGRDRQGLGIVTGAVSGNVELFEFDDLPTYERFVEAGRASGLGDLIDRVMGGYEE